MVRVALPPPPPPPRLQEEPRPRPEDSSQQMIEQEPVSSDEPPEKPAEVPEPAGEQAAPMGTNIQGESPSDGFGLVGRGGGGIIGGTGAGAGRGSGAGASRWGWYAAQVQNTIASALGRHPKTRVAELRVSVRIWPDEAGRIEQVQMVGTTGQPELDTAIEHEVLAGLTLREPPPPDMPRPIVLRISAKRP